MAKKTAHAAAIEALLPSTDDRAEHDLRVQALLSRNELLGLLESTRESQGITKGALAKKAGLEPSSVRRLLTSETANPTTDSTFRLMAAMGITLEATLPTGKRIKLVSPSKKAAHGNAKRRSVAPRRTAA